MKHGITVTRRCKDFYTDNDPQSDTYGVCEVLGEIPTLEDCSKCQCPIICPICHRQHIPAQPCPRRIASFYVGDAKIPLTDADNAWMKDHGLDILEIVEDEIADRL